MFLRRRLAETLKRFAKFPVVVVLGPRQSGKTTLVRKVFDKHVYVNLEDPDTLKLIINDPRGFLKQHENPHGIIVDEFQHAPVFLSYVQLESDEKDRPGYFVLTGSQNFLMNESITQSLAGRAGILTLLPLSLSELKEAGVLNENYVYNMHKGSYPRIYAQDITAQELYPSYIQTYLERDARQIVNIENLRSFQMFIQLCAGRIGQLLNVEDLAVNCGIAHKTAQRWISLLEASYILFLLRPHFTNFNKRITKSPKIYFYDTGLACSLLGIRTPEDLTTNPIRGHMFENFIISDFCKQYYNSGQRPPLYFWRDNNGRLEVDCIIDLGRRLVPVEIKSGQTMMSSFFDGLSDWNGVSKTEAEYNYLVYAGDLNQSRTAGNVVSWKEAGSLIEIIENRP